MVTVLSAATAARRTATACLSSHFLFECLTGYHDNQYTRPDLKKILWCVLDHTFGRVGHQYFLFCDLMYHDIMQQPAIYQYVGDGRQRKITE